MHTQGIYQQVKIKRHMKSCLSNWLVTCVLLSQSASFTTLYKVAHAYKNVDKMKDYKNTNVSWKRVKLY